MEIKTLRVSKETFNDLVKLGGYGDSMDDIVKRVVEFYKTHNHNKDESEKSD